MISRIKAMAYALAICSNDEKVFYERIDSLIAVEKELNLGIDVVRVLIDEASYKQDVCFELTNEISLGNRYHTMCNLLCDRYL